MRQSVEKADLEAQVVNIGDIVEHIDKAVGSSGYSHDDKYVYLNDCRMKDSSKGWVDSVLYYSTKKEQGFVREKQDFLKKFKRYEQK